MQVAIAAGVAVLATGLFLAPLSAQLDDQAMRRALAIAQTTAAQPQIAEDLQGTQADGRRPGAGRGGADPEGQRRRVRRDHGHAGRALVPHRSEGDRPGRLHRPQRQRSAGKEVMEIDSGTLGRSARGKVPLRDTDGRVVGAVSVGIEYDSVRARLLHAIPGLLAYAGGAWPWVPSPPI